MENCYIPRRNMKWEEGTPMSKDDALTVIRHLKHFANRLYSFPENKPFNSEVDYKAHISELNGLQDYIEKGSVENEKHYTRQ